MTVTISPVFPVSLIVAIGLILLVVLAYGSNLLRDKAVPARWIMILGIIRLIAVGVFMICLLRPELSFSRSDTELPGLLVLLDQSQQLTAVADDTSDSRLKELIDAMRQQGLRQQLEEGFDITWVSFDDSVYPVDDPASGTIRGDRMTKDFATALRDGFNHMRMHGSQSMGLQPRVLLVSDGHDSGRADPVDVARSLGLTVYSLPPADVEAPAVDPFARVVGLQAARQVLLGSEMRFRARLESTGIVGPVDLVVTENGEEALRRRIELAAASRSQHLDLPWSPTSEGRTEYTLQVVPAAEGPVFEPSPAQSITVEVVTRKDQVLLLEDGWRWDFRFLRHILEDDPNFAMTAFVARQPGIYVQFAEPGRTVRLDGFPRAASELEWFDTIILGDVNPSYWPTGLAAGIRDMVVNRGKSLIVIAGPNFQRLLAVPELERLLPVEMPRQSNMVRGPITLDPTPSALTSAVFYTPGGGAFFETFENLPPMDQIYAPVRKRPAADLLLEVRDRRNDFGNLIVMAEHTVGRGRVLFVGTDTLWKWQMLGARDAEGRTPYQVLWQQALRSLSPQRPAGSTANLWIETDRGSYNDGDTVRLQLELEAAAVDPLSVDVEATVELPDERTLPLILFPAQEPGQWTAAFEPPLAGPMRVSARALKDGNTLAENSVRMDVIPRRASTQPLPNNLDALNRIANATGGRLLSLDNPDSWPTSAAEERQSVTTRRTIDLWRSSGLLLLLVGLLATDWLLRLLRGFV